MENRFPDEYLYTFDKMAGYLDNQGYHQWGKNILKLKRCYLGLLERNAILEDTAYNIRRSYERLQNRLSNASVFFHKQAEELRIENRKLVTANTQLTDTIIDLIEENERLKKEKTVLTIPAVTLVAGDKLNLTIPLTVI